MSPYFSKFPKMAYDIDGTGTNKRIVVDIIHRAKFIDVVRSNALIFYPYHTQEGEKPEIVASKLYGFAHFLFLYVFCFFFFFTPHQKKKRKNTKKLVASTLYGSPQYHWVILFANNIFD